MLHYYWSVLLLLFINSRCVPVQVRGNDQLRLGQARALRVARPAAAAVADIAVLHRPARQEWHQSAHLAMITKIEYCVRDNWVTFAVPREGAVAVDCYAVFMNNILIKL
jgi:hypothetical protein